MIDCCDYLRDNLRANVCGFSEYRCLKCFDGSIYSGPDADILRNMSMPQIYTDSCKSVGIDVQASSANGRGFQKNSFLGLFVGAILLGIVTNGL